MGMQSDRPGNPYRMGQVLSGSRKGHHRDGNGLRPVCPVARRDAGAHRQPPSSRRRLQAIRIARSRQPTATAKSHNAAVPGSTAAVYWPTARAKPGPTDSGQELFLGLGPRFFGTALLGFTRLGEKVSGNALGNQPLDVLLLGPPPGEDIPHSPGGQPPPGRQFFDLYAVFQQEDFKPYLTLISFVA